MILLCVRGWRGLGELCVSVDELIVEVSEPVGHEEKWHRCKRQPDSSDEISQAKA